MAPPYPGVPAVAVIWGPVMKITIKELAGTDAMRRGCEMTRKLDGGAA